MAAPPTTARVDPASVTTQKILERGHKSTLAFSVAPSYALWEVDVGNPGLDGGESIKISNQHTVKYHQFVPQTLIDMGEFDVTGLHDPVLFDQMKDNLINRRDGSITRHYPDGSSRCWWAYVRKYAEAPHTNEGSTAPMVTLTIRITNYDPVNRVEAGPVLTNVTGT